jgi:hypothetical protein
MSRFLPKNIDVGLLVYRLLSFGKRDGTVQLFIEALLRPFVDINVSLIALNNTIQDHLKYPVQQLTLQFVLRTKLDNQSITVQTNIHNTNAFRVSGRGGMPRISTSSGARCYYNLNRVPAPLIPATVIVNAPGLSNQETKIKEVLERYLHAGTFYNIVY